MKTQTKGWVSAHGDQFMFRTMVQGRDEFMPLFPMSYLEGRKPRHICTDTSLRVPIHIYEYTDETGHEAFGRKFDIFAVCEALP